MNNLKILRKSRNLTLDQIAQDLQIKGATYWQWENEKRQPDVNSLIKIADYFAVTIDFVVGRDYHESEELGGLLRNNNFNINKNRIIPLIEKITKVDHYSFNLLEGYIDCLIDNLTPDIAKKKQK